MIHPRQINHKYDVSLSDTTTFIRSNHEHKEYALYEMTDTTLRLLYVPDSKECPVTIEDVDVMRITLSVGHDATVSKNSLF